MKKIVIAFFNLPLLVIIVSLVIAGAIGTLVTQKNTRSSELHFVSAVAGSVGSSAEDHITLAFLSSGRILSVGVKVGDMVKKDDVLASLDPENTAGAITQAQAALDTAQANYQKVLNGATGPTVDAAQATLNTATVARDQVTKEQDLLVKNAYAALLNDSLQAYPQDTEAEDVAPTITGSYTLKEEGDIIIKTFASSASLGVSFNVSGLVTGSGVATNVTPQPIGNSGLYIQFPQGMRSAKTWIISIPNTKASDYIVKYNAYQTAVQTRTQAIATADAAVKQAQSNLALVIATARPEDVQAAQAQIENARGALQIAQAAYDNTLLHAPQDGVVTAVHISPGQIAVPNAPAVELTGTASAKAVAVMIPQTALIDKDGKEFVLVRTASGAVEREVTVGESDATNVEVASGLSAGDEVAIQQ